MDGVAPPIVHVIPATVFTPEEREKIRAQDLYLMANLMRVGKELAFHPHMNAEDGELETVLTVDEERQCYTLLFTYPPAIREIDSARLDLFAKFGLPTGQVSKQNVVPGFETHYIDHTGRPVPYDSPRFFVRVTAHMYGSPNCRGHSLKMILEESFEVIAKSATSSVDGTMVYRHRETTGFAQSGSPRSKRMRQQANVMVSSSPVKRPRLMVQSPQQQDSEKMGY